MKTQTQYTLAILLFLVSYGRTKASDLDYSTEELRIMWFDCYNVFTKEYSEIPERIKLPLCDCYIDYLRGKNMSKWVRELTPNDQYLLGFRDC